jgi:hypothetical protein
MSGQHHILAALSPGKNPVPIKQEAGWDPSVCLDIFGKMKNLLPLTDRPARSLVTVPAIKLFGSNKEDFQMQIYRNEVR